MGFLKPMEPFSFPEFFLVLPIFLLHNPARTVGARRDMMSEVHPQPLQLRGGSFESDVSRGVYASRRSKGSLGLWLGTSRRVTGRRTLISDLGEVKEERTQSPRSPLDCLAITRNLEIALVSPDEYALEVNWLLLNHGGDLTCAIRSLIKHLSSLSRTP